MAGKNVIIAQSGGPSTVINNTLRGIIEACRNYPGRFGHLYGGWHGIEGVLKEELLDLSSQSQVEIDLLRTTPAAGSIGTCRYKLREHQQLDFKRIIEVFKAHDIGYFFYIGGNDSQHTALKVSQECTSSGLEIISVGVPKTIDNDIGDNEFRLIDHTPGYGSVARYWAHMIKTINEENMGSSPADPVMVLQAMGRSIGYIPAAARLADPKRELPLQIYLAESGMTMESLTDNVKDCVKKYGRCMVVVSEGFDVGNSGEALDAFGHTEYGASRMSVQQTIVNHLNNSGILERGSVRGQIPGTDQRHAMIFASDTDLEEAFLVGQKAVDIALNDGNGWMATILRNPGPGYSVRFDKVPLEKVALSERTFPLNWISASGIDVTDDFISYALPLMGNEWINIPLEDGLPRFTRFEKKFAVKKLEPFTPQAYSEQVKK